MIKRLIFDVDDTLIEWKGEYWNTLEEVCRNFNIPYSKEMLGNIINAIDTYELHYEYYNKQTMLEHMKTYTNYNLDLNFLEAVLKAFRKCVPEKDEELIGVLNYLSKKYELVVLTNWFKKEQIYRLKNFGIKKFFPKVFASENFKIKPNKEAFIIAMENKLPEECIMIGDSLEKDIQPAINVGMKAIYINRSVPKEEKKNYIIINNITELKDIL